MRRAWLLLSLAACATTPPSPPPQVQQSETPPVAAPVISRWSPTPPPASGAPVPRHFPEVTTFKLRSGLTVVAVAHPRPLVRMRLIFPSGSSSDSSARAGSTWFSLALLGSMHDVTKSDGTPDFDEQPLRKQVFELGASFRYDVTPDASWVGIEGYAKDTRRYLEILSEAVRHPRHGEGPFLGLLDGARDAVDEEQLSDTSVLERHVMRLAFGDESAGTAQGTGESLSRLGLEEIIDRQKQLVQPRGATLLIVGNVEALNLRAAVEGTLGGWSQSGEGARSAPAKASPSVRRTVTFLPRQGARTTTVCAARPLGDVKVEHAVLQVAAEALSLRLSAQLRERSGLTYDVNASTVSRYGTRALVVCSRFASSSTQAGLEQLLQAIDTSGTQGFTEDELESASRLVASSWERAATSLDGLTSSWTTAIGARQSFEPEKGAAAAREVKPEAVRALTPKILQSRQFQLVLSGDRGHVEPVVSALKLGAIRTPVLTRTEPD